MKRFINFITSLTTIKRPQLILGGLWMFAVTSLVYTASPASANWLSEQAGKATASMLSAFFSSLGWLMSWVSTFCASLIINIILPGQNSLIFGEELYGAWKAMLDLANIIFFLTLFISAIFIITRQTGYNFKKTVTALITAIALANLSLIIVQVTIEAGDALRNFSHLIPAFGMNGGNTGEIREWLRGLVLPEGFDIKTIESNSWRKAWVQFQVMVAQAIIAYVLFRLVFVLVERAIRLAILAIFGPIQAALSILPQKELQGLGGNWFSDVLRWVLVLPVSFILIGIARLIMPTNSAKVLQEFLQSANDSSAMTSTGTFFHLIIGLGILASASTVPQLLKAPISSLTNMIPGAASKLGQSALKSVKTDLGARGKDLAFRAFRNVPGYKKIAGMVADRKQQIGNQAKQQSSFAEKAGRENSVNRYSKNKQELDIRIKNELDAIAKAKDFDNYDDWKSKDKESATNAERDVKNKHEKSNLGLRVDEDSRAFMAAIADELESESKKDRNADELAIAIKDTAAGIRQHPENNELKIKLSALLMQLKRKANEGGTKGFHNTEVFNKVVGELESERSELGIYDKVSLNQIRTSSDKKAKNQITGEDYINRAQLSTKVENLKKSTSGIDASIKVVSTQTLKALADNDGLLEGLANLETNFPSLTNAEQNSIEQVLGSDASPNDKNQAIMDILNPNRSLDGGNKEAAQLMAQSLANGISIAELPLAKNAAQKAWTSMTGSPKDIQNTIHDIIELRNSEPALEKVNQKINSIPPADAYVEMAKNILNIEYGKSYDAKFVQDAINQINSAIANNPNPNAKLGEILDPDLLDKFSGFFDASGVSTMNPGANLNSSKGVADMEFKKALDVFTQIDKGLNT